MDEDRGTIKQSREKSGRTGSEKRDKGGRQKRSRKQHDSFELT